jgi:nitroreductase
MTDYIEAVNWIIQNRRSIKPRLLNGAKIDDTIVWQILENANLAPTHCLTQPWLFKVFTGEGLQKLADFQANLYQKNTPEAKFKQDKFDRLKSNLLKSSHVIVICMHRHEQEIIPELEEIEAVACSVQNISLTATAYGIASFWGSGGATYTQELKEFLGLGEKDLCLGYLYLGYTDAIVHSSRRSPIRDKVEWINGN